MFERYPHKAKLRIVIEEENFSGIHDANPEEFNIEGRFEPAARKNGVIDYRAKFYCVNLNYLLKKFMEAGFFPEGFIALNDDKQLRPFSIDGQTLIYNEKSFEIIMLHNYQSHCEIWVQ